MNKLIKVPVFESDLQHEIQLIKSKLDDAKIDSNIENQLLPSTTNSSQSMFRILVDIKDENKAFEIIDTWLKNNISE